MLSNRNRPGNLFYALAREDRADIARYLREGGHIDEEVREALAEFIEDTGRRVGEKRGRRSGTDRWTTTRRIILGIAVENLRAAHPSYAKKDAAIRFIAELTDYSERSIRTALSEYKAALMEDGLSAEAHTHIDVEHCLLLELLIRKKCCNK